MAKLLLTFKGKVLQEILLAEGPIRIGRDPGNAIQIDNLAVSRVHAEICKQGYPWYIEDLKSTNGTFLNEKRLSNRCALNHNDQITIGKHTLVFIEEAKDRGQKERTNYHDADATICVKK